MCFGSKSKPAPSTALPPPAPIPANDVPATEPIAQADKKTPETSSSRTTSDSTGLNLTI